LWRRGADGALTYPLTKPFFAEAKGEGEEKEVRIEEGGYDWNNARSITDSSSSQAKNIFQFARLWIGRLSDKIS
jgi:hypothetical protein